MRSTCLGALILFAACSSGAPTAAPTAHDSPNATAKDIHMAWWQKARFGMFVHWGLYAIPAGAWKGQTNYGEWIRDSAHIPVGTYETFQPQWNPTRFEAEAWAKMAADAGMKYLVITSKHHDGFCLFDSKQTDWDVMNTPHGRDILRELRAACERHGVRFCTYHSIMDWHHPDYLPRRPWEVQDRPAAGADFARFEQYLHAQVTEVVQNYRPAVMWFDGEWENTWNHERGVRLFELCRSLNPGMIVNNRVDVHRGGMGGFNASSEAVGDFATPEQEIPATGMPGVDWESCMTMNSHWGWNQADRQWKSTTQLLRNLIDIASKGGNYLLNIGPRADGTFPPEAVQRLAEIGVWMQKNAESIHGTTASVFNSLPFGRCTVRRAAETTKLYLHVFDVPADKTLRLPGLVNRVRRSHLLANPATELRIVPGGGAAGASVVLPDTANDPHALVAVVEIDGAPILLQGPTITAESDQFVRELAVTIAARSGDLPVHYTLDGSEPTPASPRAQGPVRITASCVVKARAFRGEQPSETVERAFTKVVPSPPVEPVAGNPGLRVSRHVADWSTIPDDFRALLADTSATTATVTTGKAPGENVAMRFTGFLDVPADELYRFALASDDGSKLWIDGQVVVDNDGLHSTVEKQGARALGRGLHPIEVMWFNRTGGAELKLRWAKPGGEFEEVLGRSLRH